MYTCAISFGYCLYFVNSAYVGITVDEVQAVWSLFGYTKEIQQDGFCQLL